MRKKGFTLLEILIAAIILIVVGTGIAGVYVIENALLKQAKHRLEAVNYARNCASLLHAIPDKGKVLFWYGSGYDGPAELAPGVHTTDSDPSICTLPTSYFKDKLNAWLMYEVDKLKIREAGIYEFGVMRVKITVTWNEKFPKETTKTEEFFAAPAYYEFLTEED